MKINCLISIVLIILFASCEKDRECRCSITTTYPHGTVNADGTDFSTSTSVIVFEDATRRKAKTLCKDHVITTSDGYTIEKECKVKLKE